MADEVILQCLYEWLFTPMGTALKTERGESYSPNPIMRCSSSTVTTWRRAAPSFLHRIVKESEPESVRNCVFSNVTGEVSEGCFGACNVHGLMQDASCLDKPLKARTWPVCTENH